MPKTLNQKLKLLYLARILWEQTDEYHPISTKDLISFLEQNGISAERKSIYSDMEALQLFGIDVQRTGGNASGWYIGQRPFEIPELKLLTDAVQVSHFITTKKSEQLIHKLEALTNKYQAQQLQRQVVIYDRVKNINEQIYYAVDAIHQSFRENRQIQFIYMAWEIIHGKVHKIAKHNEKIYTVSPLSLTWDDENYYMIAYDEDEHSTKHFRVDKMEKVAVIPSERTHIENFNSAEYSKKTFGMFGGKEETVRLEFSSHLIGAIIDRFGKDYPIRIIDEKHFAISVRASISPPFLSWLFQFSGDVKIISPQSVKDAMNASCRNFSEQV